MKMELNYTLIAIQAYEEFEKNLFEHKSDDCYSFLKSSKITLNDMLWYQAYEGFNFLSETQFKNEMTASEVRRYIFLNKMNGRVETRTCSKKKEPMTVYVTDDGEYNSLKDENLISRMVKIIQNSFKQTNMQDSLLFTDIPTNPERLKKKFLVEGTTERWPLIRLALALRMKPDDFHRILTNGAFFRDLSAAVPREMVVLYCLANEIYEGETIAELLKYADNRKNELEIFPRTNHKVDTKSFDELVKSLRGMAVDEFKRRPLEDSCRYEAEKQDIDHKQYSVTATELILSKTMKGTKAPAMTRNAGNDSVYLTDTILEYGRYFPLEQYGFLRPRPHMVMSNNMFVNFLNYRIVSPVERSRVTYSMDSGNLPDEIADSVLTYTKLMNYGTRSHRIERDDILVVSFYHFLMERWADGKSLMVVESQTDADRLWRSFMNEVNASLTNTGYAKITRKNPLDALLSIAMRSVNPLECYGRIYELNVLSSMAEDGYSEVYYPARNRTESALNDLTGTFMKFRDLNLIETEKVDAVKRFCSKVRKAYGK